MTTDQDRAAAAIRANPEPHHGLALREDFEPVVTGWLGFERHEPLWKSAAAVLIAAGLICLMVAF